MSLINQMLKDLQEQEKGRRPVPENLQAGPKRQSFPVSTPVMLICAGTMLLGLTWWAGSFLSRPAASIAPTAVAPVEHRQIDKDAPASVTAKPAIADPVQSPAAASVAKEVRTLPVVESQNTGNISAAGKAGERTALTSPMEPRQEQKAPTPAQASTSKPPEVAPARPSRKETADIVRPLNPDKLPGAVQSTSRNFAGHEEAMPLGSSYKMADQAYTEGKLALSQAQPELAVKSLQQALQLYAGHLPARELLAGIYDKNGKDKEAMDLLNEGFKIAPDYIGFRKIHARILARNGDFNTAITVMMRGGLPTVKSDPDAHEFLATLYHRLGESYLAAQTYRNLLAVWPQNGNYWYGLGDILEKQGELDEAARCYRSAVATKNLSRTLQEEVKKRLNAHSQPPPA